MLDVGLGVEADLEHAAAYASRACEGGNEVGCGNLAEFLEKGRGVEVDLERALALYRQSCADGLEWSCEQLDRLGKSR